jgi:hypothetical protein
VVVSDYEAAQRARRREKVTTKLTGHIDEGWLGEDRSTSERQKGGSDYYLDVVIGPTCKLSFYVLARSLDEAKSIINSFLQWNIRWDGSPEPPPTPIEAFWYETMPESHRALSVESRTWLKRYVENHGEEKVKGAILTASKRIEYTTFSVPDGLTRYVGGILRNGAQQQPKSTAEPVHLTGKATSTPVWKTK